MPAATSTMAAILIAFIAVSSREIVPFSLRLEKLIRLTRRDGSHRHESESRWTGSAPGTVTAAMDDG